MTDTSLDKLAQLPRAAFVWTAGFGLMLGASLGSAVAAPLRTPVETSLWSASVFAKVLRFAGARLELHYDVAFDETRTSAFCFNHVSLLDAHTASRTIPQPFVGLMLAWHFRIPGYGWVMRTTNGIPVHPHSAGRTEELIAEARDRVAKGLSILTFPEGHRTRDGNVGPFKRGVFFMARDAGIPVVPVAVRGLYEVNKKGSWLFRPGAVSVRVGPQIETAGLDEHGITALAVTTQHAVAEYVAGRDPDGALMSGLAGWSPG